MELEKDPDFKTWWRLGASAIHMSVSLGYDDTHHWHYKMQQRHVLHPAIAYIINEGYRPVDWYQLLLEWPAVSTEDETLLAYTRDEAKGKADVRTRTSVGKYLSRHWPHAPDHIRRDWAGRFVVSIYKIDTTMEGIIAGIELGPRSCMQSAHGSIPFRSTDKTKLLAFLAGEGCSSNVPWHLHPYSVYSPEYGWGMATRNDPGKPEIVLGRALVLDAEIANVQHKGFVRSYSRNPNGDEEPSGSDEKLEAWLRDRGFKEWDGWPDGARLKKIRHPHEGTFMVPYIDGNTQCVDDAGGHLTIDENGECTCTNTDGTYDGAVDDDDTYLGECNNCGDEVYEGDENRIWAGACEDICVCGSCSVYYSRVLGVSSRGIVVQYYVHDDAAILVGDREYDSKNLPKYIVRDIDGDYRLIDDVIYVDDEYYSRDDERIVYCEDSEWRLRDECWQCALMHTWYSDDEDPIEVDGETYSEAGLKAAIKKY